MDSHNWSHQPAKQVLMDLVWGSIGGLSGTLVSHPIDTVRIRLQLQDSNNQLYKGIGDWFNKTIKNEGASGLYKGILAPIVFQCPTYALLFAGKEFGDRVLTKYGNFSENTKSLLAGWIGGWFSTLISCPAELLKIRAQSNAVSKTHYLELWRSMVKDYGVSVLYKGYLSTLIRDIPAFAVYFGIFEIGWNEYLEPSDSFSKTLGFQVIFGSIAGVASWLITYPIDIVKTVIQTSDESLTIRKVFRESYSKYGTRFFLKGALATSIRAVPMETTCLIMYTQLKSVL